MLTALLIFGATYLVLAIGRLPGFRVDRTGAAIIGAALMLAANVLTVQEAYHAINYDTIMLLFGMMIVVANLRLSGPDSGECVRVIQSDGDEFAFLSWSNQGIASASWFGVGVWDTDSGDYRKLDGHRIGGGCAWTVAYSGSGSLASGGEDRTVRTYDPHFLRCQRVLQGHTEKVWSVSWAAGGRGLVASSSMDRTVRIWAAAVGECECVLEGHSNEVLSVAWAPDDGPDSDQWRLASGSVHETVRVWDINSGRCIHALRGKP